MVVKYPKAHTFAEVKPGDVFSYYEGVYIRIADKCDFGRAINIRNGEFNDFMDDCPVVILDGSFVVGG